VQLARRVWHLAKYTFVLCPDPVSRHPSHPAKLSILKSLVKGRGARTHRTMTKTDSRTYQKPASCAPKGSRLLGALQLCWRNWRGVQGPQKSKPASFSGGQRDQISDCLLIRPVSGESSQGPLNSYRKAWRSSHCRGLQGGQLPKHYPRSHHYSLCCFQRRRRTEDRWMCYPR
jgi:hypothetical protein